MRDQLEALIRSRQIYIGQRVMFRAAEKFEPFSRVLLNPISDGSHQLVGAVLRSCDVITNLARPTAAVPNF